MEEVNKINKVKINPVPMKVHPDFRDETVEEIVQVRIENKLETNRKPATYFQITKAIHNFFKANPKIRKLIEEVEING